MNDYGHQKGEENTRTREETRRQLLASSISKIETGMQTDGESGCSPEKKNSGRKIYRRMEEREMNKSHAGYRNLLCRHKP